VFQPKKRISNRNAYNIIVTMALHGNHYNDIHGNIQNASDIKTHYQQNGQNFKDVITKCRDYSEPVPIYENLTGAQWQTENASVSRPHHATGEFEPVVSGTGTYNESDYWATFEVSREDFEQAITSGRFERFLSAVNAGIASIEAFINHQYLIRSRATSNDPALRKDLEFKIKSWPKTLTGTAFDLSTRTWSTFAELKALRDERFQHRKTVSTGITRGEQLRLLNLYKIGIARLLVDLHIHFGHRCPAAIIRCAYYPEIEMIRSKGA